MSSSMVGYGGALVVFISLVIQGCDAREPEGASMKQTNLNLNVDNAAVPSDVGLPDYPGSKPYKESKDSDSAANIGVDTPFFGFKIIAMNLETPDTPDQVSEFYRQALSKYGTVLDCSKITAESSASNEKDQLSCEPGETGNGSTVYKVGTEDNHRVVAIKPHDQGTRFSLVHVLARGNASK